MKKTKNIKTALLAALIFLLGMPSMYGQRIKDISFFQGNRAEQLIGYGLVVGLAGTGDSQRSTFTVQSVTSMLKRFGITVPQTDLRTKNVAAVMITATLAPNLKPGAEFDLVVSSLGDATSLHGGTLLVTPLSSMEGRVFGYGQGPVSVGGYDVATSTGSRISRNHSLAGRVPAGGILDIPATMGNTNGDAISIYLRNPDYTTANNVSEAINSQFGDGVALSLDASEIRINVPGERRDNLTAFISELENIEVQKDVIAKVVLNERTGTIVAGSNVKIYPVTISHGNLNINIRSFPIVSQPGAFSSGSTVFYNNLVPTVNQDTTNAIAIEGASTVQEVAAALNSLKVPPRDIISIFQALKEAGALIAELVIL